MRLDRHFREIEGPTVAREQAFVPVSFEAFCPAGSGLPAPWAEAYRLAYLRSVEALRPTRYDRALAAPAN